MIPYGRQCINENDIQIVIDVLRSDYLTQGPAVPLFEKAVSDRCGAKYGVAVNSATSALHLACLSLGVGYGDRVWTSPITFVASANCALYCGAEIDFVDIDPRTYNMSVECLTEKLSQAEKDGLLPKVVIPVHMCGQACEMETICGLGKRYGFSIIEDASHAIGGKYQFEPIGNCRFSDITIFSFHPVKIITCGEGGMAVTNDAKLAEKMTLLRSHGITRELDRMTRKPEGAWYYQQLYLGYNYRMTELQAALGFSQLQRLEKFVSRRHIIAEQYNELLSGLPVVTPWQHPDCYSAMHLYVIRLIDQQIYATRKKVYEELHAAGIGVNVHYIPVYLQPFYERKGFSKGYCVEAERYYNEALSLPIFPALEESQQKFIVSKFTETVKEVM